MKKTIISLLLATVSVTSVYALDFNDLNNILKQLPGNTTSQTTGNENDTTTTTTKPAR